MQIKLVSVLNSVLLSIKCRCYFNPSASPVIFNPLLFSLGVMFTFFRHGILDEAGIECHLLIGTVDVLEGEIYQTVFLALAHIEEVVAIHVDILHRDVVALAQWHILSIARLEELGPWADDEETAGLALYVINRYVLVMLEVYLGASSARARAVHCPP